MHTYFNQKKIAEQCIQKININHKAFITDFLIRMFADDITSLAAEFFKTFIRLLSFANEMKINFNSPSDLFSYFTFISNFL